jgi:glycine cleavage system H protein
VETPENLSYTSDHEWVQITGSTVRIGITDYAQDALGDVVFVQIPDVGVAAALGATVSEVESTKSVSDIYAPLAGTISAVNPRLADNPELLNTDPYGEGWIFEMTVDDIPLSGLLDAAAYRALTEA